MINEKKPIAGRANRAIQVMIVDDSAVVRGMVTKMLAEEPEIDVVATASNGRVALQKQAQHDLDVIVLDIEMPVMDGLTALTKLLEVDPTVKVIMASTLTLRNADISIRALSAGAADYVPKPTSPGDLGPTGSFRRELVEKIISLGGARRALVPKTDAKQDSTTASIRTSHPISLRKPGIIRPRILAIGSSTGGPQAMFTFFSKLAGAVDLPILITQHMPPTFTKILAEHLTKWSGSPCAEANEGEVIQHKRLYLAPGDFHMTVVSEGSHQVIRLNQNPKENFCRPAVDPMLRSIVQAYGASVITVILTGMGNDGLAGGKAVVDAGGTVVAQDEKSSVVWGMPGAVAMAGICSAVLPLGDLAGCVANIVNGGKR